MTLAPQQGFPRLDTPLVNADGSISIPWYRLLVQLYRQGGGSAPINQSVVLQLVGGDINAYDTEGNFIATLQTADSPGGAAQVLSPVVSPFYYTASVSGTLLAFGCRLELSRDSGANWQVVSLTGGALPMLTEDEARMSWFSAVAPSVVWLPAS